MTNLDRVVTLFRRWAEDRLPWYDRRKEERAIARTERIRRRSIAARISSEGTNKLTESRLGSYRRVSIGPRR